MADIAVTWPKKRSLSSYYAELENAERLGLVINFKIPTMPQQGFVVARCYMVHNGYVRCWNRVLNILERGPRDVKRIEGGFWSPGIYVVRSPARHELRHPVPMKGFQGYRYVNREEMGESRLSIMTPTARLESAAFDQVFGPWK